MTKQEIFNKVYLGLAGQGFVQSNRAFGDGYSCAYRGEEGRKCAAGHLIPDDKYGEWMEGRSVLSGSLFGIPAVHVQSVQKAIAEVTGLEGVDFVADLQHLHDHNKDTQEMQVAFIIFARKQNLTIPELS